MLNSLLASSIANSGKIEKEKLDAIACLTADSEEFINSNRLAFSASHPQFIKFLEEHGLTTDEINYVCLYAIGLRGKEVGYYINSSSHFNISVAVRAKLGIKHRETNLSKVVQRLLHL